MEALVEEKYSTMGILNMLQAIKKGRWGLGGFGRSFMAIIAIKLRKKVNWGQLSIA